MPFDHKPSLPPIDNSPIQVQMTIFSDGREYTAYICADLGMFHRFHIGLTPHDVEELNAGLQWAMEQVTAFEENSINSEALIHLAQKGKFAFKRIFAEGILRETINKFLKVGATIQIASRDFTIPWESLYDGPLGTQMDVSYFWGMRYIISRALIQDDRPGDFVSSTIQSLCPRVGLITYNELAHVVEKEVPALKELDRQKQICLVPLRSLNANQREEELEYVGRFLCEEDLHILHLACHAYEKKPLSQSYLLVSDEFTITIEDFSVQEFVIRAKPFIVLNACLTGTMSPLHTSNWAALFWERGARGVLATEFHVPDWFAAAFVEELYIRFLAGMSIGEALRVTRYHFWEKQGNPLGIAYALYSSPSLRIAKPHSEIDTNRSVINSDRQDRELAVLQAEGFQCAGRGQFSPTFDSRGQPIPGTTEWKLEVYIQHINGFITMVFSCPAGYPNVPPRVQLRTPSGGGLRAVTPNVVKTWNANNMLVEIIREINNTTA